MVKNLPANLGDASLIPGLGRSSEVGNGNPLQYSCQEDPMDRGSWRAAVHGFNQPRVEKKNFFNSRKFQKAKLELAECPATIYMPLTMY